MPLPAPPSDSSGNVVPYDCPEILPDDVIIRRVSPQQFPNGRISTMLFRQSSSDLGGGMSVDIEKLIVEAGLDPRRYVISPPFVGAVYFTASYLRGQKLMVGYDPIEENPYHGEVWGDMPKSVQKALRNAAQWYVPIEGVMLQEPAND